METVGNRSRSFKWAVGVFVAALLLAVCLLAGCSSPSSTSAGSSEPADSSRASLEGRTLDIYCGAGMTEPFQKIVDQFKSDTGCEVNVTFANAAQIQTQIKTTGEGDFFIAGSKEELKPVEDSVDSSEDLVKHIPVLAVPASNSKNISSLSDLANAERVLVGDPESTPIGKIAKKALTDIGLWETLLDSGVVTTTTTAPQIATALANSEGDAGIVWKENVKNDGVVIVDTTDLDSLIKVIPAAQLKSAKDSEAVQAFNEFLKTDQAQGIWSSYGYEQA